jgi:VCBS repeat-containing protein
MRIYGTNDQIVAVDDSVAVGEGDVSGNLWSSLMANDTDLDFDAVARRIESVDTTGTQGSVAFDASTKMLTYSAAGLDLDEGESITDSFSYQVTDGYGSSDIATVTVTVTGGADGTAGVSMTAFAPDGVPAEQNFTGPGSAAPEPILGADMVLLA